MAAVAAGVDAEVDTLYNDPADGLLAAAHQVDLLVMGSRARGGRRSVILGSVSRKVAERATCPVVIIPKGYGEAADDSVSHAAHTSAVSTTPPPTDAHSTRSAWMWVSLGLAVVAAGLLIWALTTKSDLDATQAELDSTNQQVEQLKTDAEQNKGEAGTIVEAPKAPTTSSCSSSAPPARTSPRPSRISTRPAGRHQG